MGKWHDCDRRGHIVKYYKVNHQESQASSSMPSKKISDKQHGWGVGSCGTMAIRHKQCQISRPSGVCSSVKELEDTWLLGRGST